MRLDAMPLAVRLSLIGVVTGVFSAVFGVGGGILVVPLLLAFAAFPIHAATATSLGAILVTATAGALLYAIRGDLRPEYAALVGAPAVVGALVGTHIQRRVSGHDLTLAFAALLAIVGIWLIAG